MVLLEFYARVRRKPGIADASNGAVRLDAGQCVFGFLEIAECLGLSVAQVRSATRRLEEKYEFITREGTSSGSIVTIPFVQDFQNRKSRRTRGNKHAARKPHLTETVNRDTVDGESSSNSASPHEEVVNPRVAKLHRYQEKLRKRRLGEAYRPLALAAVGDVIAERLADGYSVNDCKCVVRADAAEVAERGDAKYFGRNTWSAKNFTHKLQSRLHLEAEQAARSVESVIPWEERRKHQLERLTKLATRNDCSEAETLVADYNEFEPKFHKEKGTWEQVRHMWDRDEKYWLFAEDLEE
jgi:hypothetical protein